MNVNSEASVLLTMAGKDINLLRYIISSDIVADEIFGFHALMQKKGDAMLWTSW